MSSHIELTTTVHSDKSSTKRVEGGDRWQGNGPMASSWGAAVYPIQNRLALQLFLTKACLFTYRQENTAFNVVVTKSCL